ncbi:MAG: ribosome-associated translation inhibitor RaiA [Candidatus Moranbacteria bacterium]|nr:ribosome-associated translation inhibitor RaiA [Candidatus Moranbacteria bacterium]
MTIASKDNVRFMYKGLRADDESKAYILKRLERLDKVTEKVLHKEVEVDLDKKGKFRVEVMIKTAYDLFRAEETTESIEGSIDLVVDELKVQITKDKDKRKTLMKRGAQSIKKKVVVDKSARF